MKKRTLFNFVARPQYLHSVSTKIKKKKKTSNENSREFMVIYHANTINAKIIYTQQLDQTLKRRKHTTTTSIAITRRRKLIFRTIPQHSTSQTPRRKRKEGIERFRENATKARSHARENVQIKVTKLKHKKKEKKWKKNEYED